MMLCACTFRVRLKSLHARYVHAHERTHHFFRPANAYSS